MKRIKKLISIALALVCCFGLFGCGDKTPTPLTENDFSVWTTSATEKILQEQKVNNIDLQNNNINLGMFQNEYEASQIIISTKKDIKNVDIQVSDLVSVSDNKIPASSIAVFYEKYLEVKEIFDEETNAPTGFYPDGLVPFSSIKEYKENNIKANKNQGIYVRIKTEQNQAPGIYTGTIKITCDDIITNVPVQVEVYNFAVSEERHNKSVFLIDWNFWSGELNSTQEIYDEYVYKLFEYRLSPDIITLESGLGDIDYYIEKAYEFMQDPRCTNITIPYTTTTMQDLELFPDGTAYGCLNVKVFKETIIKYVEKSIKENFDMLKKSVCYFAFVDEAVDSRRTEYLLITSKKFTEAIKELAIEIEQNYPQSEIRDSLIQSIKDLKQVQTDAYINDTFNEYVNAWCPKVSYYHTEAERELYATKDELWWYTCIYPRAPYPTYHIEDTLLSARLLSWMQAQYNVTGNLFWATNQYVSYTGKGIVGIDEYFTGPADRYAKCNGDGFLFYPGGQYGLSEPLPSIRLEAIRDGLEEFELLNSLKEYSKGLESKVGSVNMDKVISTLTNQLYKGTQVNVTEDAFYSARNQLKNVISCMTSSAGMALLDINDNGYGKLSYKVYLNGNTTLKKDGNIVTTFEAVEGGRVYTVDLSLDNTVNSMNLSFEADGITYNYPIVANGSVHGYYANDIIQSFVLNSSNANSSLTSKEVVDGSVINQSSQESFVKLSLKATQGTTEVKEKQSVYIKGGFVSQINQKTKKIVLHLYYDGVEELPLYVRYKTSSLVANTALQTSSLTQGFNTIEIDCSSIKWKSNTVMDYLVLVIGEESAPQLSKNLYIKDVVIYSE